MTNETNLTPLTDEFRAPYPEGKERELLETVIDAMPTIRKEQLISHTWATLVPADDGMGPDYYDVTVRVSDYAFRVLLQWESSDKPIEQAFDMDWLDSAVNGALPGVIAGCLVDMYDYVDEDGRECLLLKRGSRSHSQCMHVVPPEVVQRREEEFRARLAALEAPPATSAA